jgi:hypothetical protein
MGNTPTPDATWTDFIPVTSSGGTIGGSSRYAQYRVDLATTNPNLTPVLQDATLTYTTAADTIPPRVISTTPGSSATNVDLFSTVTVKFSELMNPATITSSTFHLQVQVNGVWTDVPATVTFSGSTAILQPSVALAGNTQYQVIVSGTITDSSGNPIGGSLTWTFQTGVGTWKQVSIADFSTGVLNGVKLTTTPGGGLQLAEVFRDDFTGSTLNTSNWTVQATGVGPMTVIVANDLLAVAGAVLSSTQTFSNVPVEGRINFAASTNQHFGMATDLSAVAGNSWAIFSTGRTTDTLFARVNVSGVTQDVSLGALPTGFHVYRIDQTGSGFNFSVDGVLETTITGTFQVGTTWRIVLDSNDGTQAPLQADWVRVVSYASGGTFTSSIFDASRIATWSTVNWDAILPAGTSIIVQVRTGDSLLVGGSGTEVSFGTDTGPQMTGGFANPSAWTQVSNGGTIPPSIANARYFQYEVTFLTNDPTQTAVLQDIAFTWL